MKVTRGWSLTGRRWSSLALFLFLALAACDNDDDSSTGPVTTDEGVDSADVSEAMQLFDGLRSAVRLHFEACTPIGCIEENGWDFDFDTGARTRTTASFFDRTVSGPDGVYTVRTRDEDQVRILFTAGGEVAPGPADADSVFVTGARRVHRFSLTDGVVTEEPFDLTYTYEIRAAIGGDGVERAEAFGRVLGEATFARGAGRSERLLFDGTNRFTADASVGGWGCGGLRNEVDLGIFDASMAELDRYVGVFEATAGGDSYAGSATSQTGTESWAINALRFCSD